jgi:uncharacterized protein YcbX
VPTRIASIFRYPIKGLSPERLLRVPLAPGECLPQDRRFALALATTRFDPAHPEWLPKTNFAMLMRHERLALLKSRFDAASGILSVECDGRTVLRAPITEAAGRHAAEAFFAVFLREELGNPPRIVEAPGHAFADARRRPHASTGKYISLVNLASIGALADVLAAPVDPLRFRANFYVDGAPPWSERGWDGAVLMAGAARLRVVSPITRCAATEVNPETAMRDLDVLGALKRSFGHVEMGVYAEVLTGGEIAEGDPLARA